MGRWAALQDRVYLLLHGVICLRMGCQQVPAPGERGSGGIVTGIEERQTFSPQLLAAHPGAIFVSCLEQDREDIIALIRVCLALSDHLSHFVIKDALRVFDFPVASGGPVEMRGKRMGE